MINYKTNTTDIQIIHNQIGIDAEIKLLKNPAYDTENEFEYQSHLEWVYDNREQREQTFKKILIAEGTINYLTTLLIKEDNDEVIQYIHQQMDKQTEKLDSLKLESKELLNQYFGN